MSWTAAAGGSDGRWAGRSSRATCTDPIGQAAATLDHSGSVASRFFYDDAGRVVLMTRGRDTYLVVTDQLGSPRLVIDVASGKVADAIRYDAWGGDPS